MVGLRVEAGRRRGYRARSRTMACVAWIALVLALLATSAGPVSAASSQQSAPGVTSKTVTVGNIASLSGPIPGAFEGAPYGVEAYFAYINSKGGVNGRKLVVTSTDDAFTCQGSINQTQQLMGNVFALVGNFSLYDSCQAQVLAKHPSVPDISYALSQQAKALPNLYSPQPSPPGSQTGPFRYLLSIHPQETKVGAMSTTGSSAYSMRQQLAAMKSVGYKIVYTHSVPITQADYTSDILRMRNAGVNVLNITDLTFPGQLLAEARLQNWHPLIIDPTLYSYTELETAGPGADGAYIPLLEAMFLGQDRATNPAVDTFLTWINKTHPGFKPDLFTFYGWISAALFADALKAAGPNPTDSALYKQLKATNNFTAAGLVPSTDVGNKKPPLCYLMAQAQNNTWVRDYPKEGFTCKYAGYYYYRGQ